ncbi:MAG: hypothetical protein WCI17_02450 [bacterium]
MKSMVRYHLRVTLTPDHHRQEEQALWQVIRKARVDEVMFFVPHAEERSTGLGTDAENATMARLLAPVFRRLRQAGIAPSINFWWTVAFSEFAGLRRDQHHQFDFRWAVSTDGRTSVAVACPACPAWRAQVGKMYQTYAALKPARIWIDDDVRMTLRADMHSPCFCEACLEEMTRRTGRTFTRPELLAAILADAPNPVRAAWLDYQGDLERDIVAGLAQAVHAISPETAMGLMHSSFEIHAAEGRRWAELVAALGTPAPMCRPGMGPYMDTTGPDFAGGLSGMRLEQAAYPAGTQIAPEIENYPQTPFTKSVAFVRADLEMAQLCGIREMTFSIYRFGGRLDLETRREDIWSVRLGALKPRLQAIADLGITRDQMRGVGLCWHEEVCRHVRGVAQEPKPIFLYRERPWDQALPLMGMATTYVTGEITAFAGEQLAALSDEELRACFSRGVLLDARAAEALLQRGKGAWAGIAGRLPDVASSQETIEDARFGGLAGDIINLRWCGQAWQFNWQRGARVVSQLRGYDGNVRGHGVTVFENRLGGRVVVYPFDSQVRSVVGLGIAFPPMVSPSFLNRPRQAQLLDLLEWAGGKPLPLVVPESPTVYPLLAEQPGRLVVGVANLLADPIASLTLRLRTPAFTVRRVRALDAAGRWKTCRATIGKPSKGAVTIRTGVTLNYLDVTVLIVD